MADELSDFKLTPAADDLSDFKVVESPKDDLSDFKVVSPESSTPATNAAVEDQKFVDSIPRLSGSGQESKEEFEKYAKKAAPDALTPGLALSEPYSLDFPSINWDDPKELERAMRNHLPKPQGTSTGAGVARAGISTVESLIQPESILMLSSIGGAPAVLQRAVSVGFAALMVKNIPEKLAAAKTAKTPGEKAEAYTGAALDALMAAGALGHGTGKIESPKAEAAAKALRSGGMSQEDIDESFRRIKEIGPAALRAASDETIDSLVKSPALRKQSGFPDDVIENEVARRAAAVLRQTAPKTADAVRETVILRGEDITGKSEKEPTPDQAAITPSATPPTPSDELSSPAKGGTSSLFKQAQKEAAASVTPAIQTPSGEVTTGEDHVAAYEKAKENTPDTSGSKEGFVDNDTGQFISREQAAEKTGLPTQTEPGKIHSSDLKPVIDETVYHSTAHEGELASEGVTRTGASPDTVGIFTTPDEEAAKGWGGPEAKIRRLRVKLYNPFDVRDIPLDQTMDKDQLAATLRSKGLKITAAEIPGEDWSRPFDEWKPEIESLTGRMKDQGFDGYVTKTEAGRGEFTEHVPFDAKSLTEEKGGETTDEKETNAKKEGDERNEKEVTVKAGETVQSPSPKRYADMTREEKIEALNQQLEDSPARDKKRIKQAISDLQGDKGSPKAEEKPKGRSELEDVLTELQAARDAKGSGLSDEETDSEIASLERRANALREKATAKDIFGDQEEAYREALSKEGSADPETSEKAQTEREKLEEDLPEGLRDILYGREPKAMKRSGKSKESGSINIPGAADVRKFVEEDVKPFVVEGARNTVEAMRQIKTFIAPANADELATTTAHIIRQNTAELARKRAIAVRSLKKASAAADRLSNAENLAIIDAIETGARQRDPATQSVVDTMRQAMDDRVAQVRALGTGKLEKVIQDYFPHIWKDPKTATSVYAKIFGKRPLEGPKSFLKQRTIPTTADGIAQGLEPVTHNFVDLHLMKLHEMDRYIMGQKIMAEMKDRGIAEFVRAMQKPSDGYVKIDDRIAQVVQMRPTVKADGSIGAPEMIVRGHYYAPEGAARVLNNYLSPGLHGIKVYEGFRWLGNVLNQAQLGFSAFHLGFVSVDSGVSKLALGIEYGLSGRPLEGLRQGIQAPVAPVLNMIRGNKALAEYYKPGSQGAEVAQLLDLAIKGGGRVSIDDFYKTNAYDQMQKAWRSGNRIGAAVRAPFAALEKTMAPILEYAVPRMKMGMFMDMARAELERIGPNASIDEQRAVAAKAWDSVDNRMGQLVYDNLFWNRSFKDALMASQRSVGWNLGTIREIGGGIADTLATPARLVRQVRGEANLGEKAVTHKMAYVIALPIATAILGSIYQKLHTGMLPGQNKDGTFGGDAEALKDMFLPRTGKTNSQGAQERVQLPSYMKDVEAYKAHPFKTIANKAAPEISAIAQMLNNQDYYGTEIRNKDDPFVKQVGDELAFAAKQFVPFSVQSEKKRGSGVTEAAESQIGITPAPAEFTRTPAHQAMMDAMMKRMPSGAKTKEEQSRYELRKAVIESGRSGKPIADALADAEKKGVKFSRIQQKNISKAVREDPRALMFSHLTKEEAQKVYDLSNKAEKALFKPLLEIKLHGRVKSNSIYGGRNRKVTYE